MSFRQSILGGATKEKFDKKTVEGFEILIKKPGFVFLNELSLSYANQEDKKSVGKNISNIMVDFMINNLFEEKEGKNESIFSEGDKEILLETVTPLHPVVMGYLTEKMVSMSEKNVKKEKKNL